MKSKLFKNKFEQRKFWFLVCVFAFPILHFLVFWLYINVSSIGLAFVNKAGLWNDFANFKWVFQAFKADDVRINMSIGLRNTFLWWCSHIAQLLIAFVLTYFFYKKLSGYKFFRVVLYLPAIVSTVVMVGVFKKFVEINGPLATLYKMIFNREMPDLLYSTKYAMGTMLIYNFWNGYGVSIILFSGAMSRISTEIIESARLDGVSAVKEMTRIIVPLIWPTVTTQIILSVAGLFGMSGPVLLFTNGDYGTTTLNFIMFQQYYEFGQIERSAAIGLLITLISIPLVVFSRLIMAKMNDDVEY